MPRLFTGLEIPPDIAAALAGRRGGLRHARWIEPSDYHVTLRFLGDVDTTCAEAMHEALVNARRRGPIEIVLDGLSSFGGAKPRALIAAVAANRELADLQAEHEHLAREAGAAPERRKFTPHVTLARLRRDAHSEDVATYLAQQGLFATLRFSADRVALFSARESTGGGPYVVEAVYPLA
jgi:2'-5' RNA ligase